MEDRNSSLRPKKNAGYRQTMAACFYAWYLPALIYEVIIANKGRPVVISGNCMLVELDPKWGFLETEIPSYWKAFVGITGL